MALKNQDPGKGRVKKPYEKPAIVSHETLEAMAVVCSNSPPAKMNRLSCPLGPLMS